MSNKEKPFVSIVIPCFNEEDYIGSCIDSVQSQQYYGGYEIIAVDNDSIDNTAGIIKDKGIMLEHTEKRGPAVSKNRGIKRAKGDVIVFIDGDCVAAENWLNHMISGFKHQSIGCVAGEIAADENKDISPLDQFLIKKSHLSQANNMNHPFLSYAATANAAYRREVFEEIGVFDEDLISGEDADMSWRMQLYTDFKLRYCPLATVYHPHEMTILGLFRQKQRHAYGSVMLSKKYKKYWKLPQKSFRQLYWEYRSIIIRLVTSYTDYQLKRNPDSSILFMQAVLEAGWKCGLIRGSIVKRVWHI